jgi:small subunit ribosomal protein S1
LSEQTLAGWLTDAYDYRRPRWGQILEGVILRVDKTGIVVDVGLKREGIVSHRDVERLGEEAVSQLGPGQEVTARIVRPEDRDGNLILSLYQARLEKEWARAQDLLDSGRVFRVKVTGCNKGGLEVKFGHLRGFVPGSHLRGADGRRLPLDKREEKFRAYVGQELPLKVIEVKRRRRRLILSERLARQVLRKQRRERLLEELLEGQIVRGTVSQLCDFGAFVDVGGADGLVHISELAWRRIRHPGEVVRIGDEIDVYVLRLDHTRKRIGLSLKRTQPDPWSLVELSCHEGQLISGVVTNVVDFGAFVALDVGVEGLIHISELADPPPEDPRSLLRRGDELVVRIVRIEASRRRIGLSLKSVPETERDEWLWAEGRDAIALEDDVTLIDEAGEDESASTVSDVSLGDEEDLEVENVAEGEVLSSVLARV